MDGEMQWNDLIIATAGMEENRLILIPQGSESLPVTAVMLEEQDAVLLAETDKKPMSLVELKNLNLPAKTVLFYQKEEQMIPFWGYRIVDDNILLG